MAEHQPEDSKRRQGDSQPKEKAMNMEDNLVMLGAVITSIAVAAVFIAVVVEYLRGRRERRVEAEKLHDLAAAMDAHAKHSLAAAMDAHAKHSCRMPRKP
jgi:hypothetical protein